MQNAVCLNRWLLRVSSGKSTGACRHAVRFLSNEPHKVIALPGPKIRKRAGSKVFETPGRDLNRSIPRSYFSQEAIDTIFGGQVLEASAGNRILRELQQRRVTGSLADKGLLFEELKDEKLLQQALNWLREKYPVDEAAAAELFAEREDAKFRALEERTYIAKGIKWGLIKGDREEAKRVIEEGADAVDDSNVAKWKARFDAARRAGRVAEQKEREEQLMIEVKSEQLRSNRQTELDELRENALKRRDELEKSSVLDPEELLDEKKSRTSRLLKPTLFGAAFLAGCALLLNPNNVTGPHDQVHLEWTPALRMCVGIAAVNALVLCAWKIPRTWWVLNRYFMLSAGIPNSFSIVGTIFSHQFLLTHWATNTAILFAFGLPLYDELGVQNFIAVYLGTGVAASLTALIFHVLRKNYLYVSLGASGAGSGLMGVYSTLQPERTLRLPFSDQEIKFSSLAAVLALSAVQFAPMLSPATWLYLDHVTHVGGWVAGLGVGLYLRSRAPKQDLQLSEPIEEDNANLLNH